MAILVIYTGPGIDRMRYEALRKEIDWERNPPAGVVVQAAGFDKRGMRAADVWESQHELAEFLTKRLMPAMKKLKIPAPLVEVYPADHVNAYASIAPYTAKLPVPG